MTLRERIYRTIFESDTKRGKDFDVILLILILLSVLIVMLDSVAPLSKKYSIIFNTVEWILTVIFTIEYLTRIVVHPKPLRYIFSFWGFIDLLSILPTFLSLMFSGYRYMLVVRIFRLMRVFRIFKLTRFNKESQMLMRSLKASLYKISLFFLALMMVVTIMGTIMYVVEGEDQGFDNIPESIYWAIITITTVGYGDMVPKTLLGKFISAFSMIIGYSIIAVPTGIVTAEMTKARKKIRKRCPQCFKMNRKKANFCERCGASFSKISTDIDEIFTEDAED